MLAARAMCRVLLTHSAHPVPSLAKASTTASSAASINALTTSLSANNPSIQSASAQEVWAHVTSLANVSEIVRRSRNPGWVLEELQFPQMLQRVFTALQGALDPTSPQREMLQREANGNDPSIVAARAKVAKEFPVKETFPANLHEQLFNIDMFAKMVGRANLNAENHGSLCEFSFLSILMDGNEH